MFEPFGLMRTHFGRICQEFGLTPAQGRALIELEPGRPRAMSWLAGRLGNDASNITGLADRLEDRGLVERGTYPEDRRIKALSVTAGGRS